MHLGTNEFLSLFYFTRQTYDLKDLTVLFSRHFCLTMALQITLFLERTKIDLKIGQY
jgi:hypothetical protein